MEQIDPRHLLVKVVKVLGQLKIPYIITGGIAVLIWGRPRFTADIDIVIKLQSEKIDDLEKALLELSNAGYIDKETIKQALERRGEFNFIDGETGVKVDFWIEKGAKLNLLRFKRKKAKIIKGQRVYFISPEDLILSKLEWYQKSQSTRQLEDIESILKISGSKLDRKYLNRWAKKLGVLSVLKKLM